MTRKENILYYLLLLFFAVLFYAHTDTINGIIIGCVLLCAILFNSLKDKWQILKQRKHIIFMILFFAMLGVSLMLSDNKDRGFRYLDTRLALFYFPVTIGLVSISKTLKQKILLGFAFITTVACLVCLVYSIYASDFFKEPALLYNDSLTHIIGRQSIYISLLVNIPFLFTCILFFLKPFLAEENCCIYFLLFFYLYLAICWPVGI